MPYTIRTMLLADAPQVARLHSESIKQLASKGKDITQDMIDIWSTVTPEKHIRSLEFEDKFVLVFTSGDLAIVGSTLKAEQTVHKISKDILPEGTYELAMLYADPKYAGKGCGAIMLKYLEDFLYARGAKHIVLESSTYAEGFYGKHGYSKIQDIIHPIRGGKTMLPAVMMIKELEKKFDHTLSSQDLQDIEISKKEIESGKSIKAKDGADLIF